MSDSQSESAKEIDPLEQWREMRDGYMGAWAKAMGEAVNSEAYAKNSGTMLETYLSASAPFRDAQKKAMLSALEQLHMPSQADFISLADRMSNVELLLDDMDAKLDQIIQLATSAAAKAALEPKAEAKHAFVAKAETKPAFVAEAETKPLFEARAEAKPAVHAAAKSAFAAEAETKPLFETRVEAKPAVETQTETKPIAPKKSFKTAKKGSR
jgi:hypothetical protein